MSRIVDIETHFGVYHVHITEMGVRRLKFPGQPLPEVSEDRLCSVWSRSTAAENLEQWVRQELQDYHKHKLKSFSLPLDLEGATAFRLRVWEAMGEIPYGTTVSYGELATIVKCNSARAIGQACGANPVPIIIPCHRVVSSDKNNLGGWGGPEGMKEKLLRLEGTDG